MLTLLSCKSSRHGARSGVPEEMASHINLCLCKIFEAALAVKVGVRPSSARLYLESSAMTLHEAFEGIPSMSVLHNTGCCDICALVRATRQLACSAYADDVAEFISRTRAAKGDHMRARAEYRLEKAFSRFLEMTTLDRQSRLYQAMHTARDIMREVQSNCQSQTQLPLASVSAVMETPNMESLDSLEKRLNTTFGKHLRVIT